jgi:peroxiredoxin
VIHRPFGITIFAVLALGCTKAEGVQHGDGGKDFGPPPIEVGLPVPAYRAITVHGDSVSIAEHRGRVVLLNVWATWCIPCRVEVPVIERLHERYAPKGLDVIGVSVDAPDQTRMVEEFVKSFGVTYPIWLDSHRQILRTYMAPGVPATFVIGRDGTLLYKYLGPIPEGDPNMHRIIEQGLGI